MSESAAYNPKLVESDIYRRWEASQYFNPDKLPRKRGKSFTISMPPPNVTGDLHIGHALHVALEDLMIRYHRMLGDAALWVPGTDHAGIATQIKVEQSLAENGISRHEIGREQFLQHVWVWKKKYGDTITKQIRSMGASCDWSREHFTMDQDLTAAVQAAFVRLYEDGLLYRAERLISWCPTDQTALSDLEVKHEERAGSLWYIQYRVKKTPHSITVATTRPETLLGDTAIAVNPKDARFKDLIGRIAIVPLVNREVPIIADHRVEKDFGTGAVKVTPAHDFLDAEIGKTHNLRAITVIGPDGLMTADAGRDFEGMPIHEARTLVIEALNRDGNLLKAEDHRNAVAICDRCGTTIEPLLSKQWFVKMKPLTQKAVAAVKSGRVAILPERFKKQYFHWTENIQDWCISRQLWWGHRIPIWYCGSSDVKRMGFAPDVTPRLQRGKTTTWRLRDHGFRVGDVVTLVQSKSKRVIGLATITSVERSTVANLPLVDRTHHPGRWTRAHAIQRLRRHSPDQKVSADTPVWIYRYRVSAKRRGRPGCGEIVVSSTRPPRCPVCGGKNFVQDEDVLDTWFSSGLWTFSTLGWPRNQRGKVKRGDLKRFHPTSVMETGWDILTFWVSRMLALSLYLTGEVPFRTVYLSGLILDEQGKKMSKSRGTGIDPLVMTEKYGTDAIRLSLVIGQSVGQDFRMYEAKIAGQRNFVNKLWHIGQYVRQGTGYGAQGTGLSEKGFSSPTPYALRPKTLADRWILSRLAAVTKGVTAAIEHYDFSAAGQLLEDFAWHEFADWYLEIHKVEKNDQVLLSVFNTLLRLLHPFAPFVTEQLWQRPAREGMLIIQSWPKPGARNATAERAFADVQRTVIALRNFKKYSGLTAEDRGAIRTKGPATNLPMLEKLSGVSLQGKQAGAVVTLGSLKAEFPAERVQAFEDWRKKERANLEGYAKRLREQLKNTRLPNQIRAQAEARLMDTEKRLTEI